MLTQVATGVATDWRQGLPVLNGRMVSLRELEPGDAPALLQALSAGDVPRFMHPLPNSVEGFERFIAWAHRERQRGVYACFAVMARGSDTAIGVFQIRRLDPAWATAEWGFALGAEFWGTGMFMDAARLVVDFAFQTLGVTRLEARAAVANGRGNGALRKLGAVREAVLRRSFLCQGEYVDQALWSIIEADREELVMSKGGKVYVH
jgi:RimJ/RimL family protein N-acetyltransferase